MAFQIEDCKPSQWLLLQTFRASCSWIEVIVKQNGQNARNTSRSSIYLILATSQH